VVAGKHDDRQCPEDSIDGASLEPELAEISAGEERVGMFETLGR
jgi:hypothetical protein